MRSRNANKAKGLHEACRTDRCPAGRGGPLEAAQPSEPLPELARQGGRDKPRIPLHAGQRGTSALGTHPTSDAKGPRSARTSTSSSDRRITMTNSTDESSRLGVDSGTEPGLRAAPALQQPAPGGLPQAPRTAEGGQWPYLERPRRRHRRRLQAAVPVAQGSRAVRGSPARPLHVRAARLPGGLEILMDPGSS